MQIKFVSSKNGRTRAERSIYFLTADNYSSHSRCVNFVVFNFYEELSQKERQIHTLNLLDVNSKVVHRLRNRHPWPNIKFRKALPLQTWTGPEGSRRLRLPDLMTIGT
jgi:Sec7-like guanine-nucleotide exchange factor